MYDADPMEIIGLGLDATEIDRIEATIARYGDRFLTRIFTEGEVAYCRRKRDAASSFAARFAAKEATMKALGTGHSRGVLWRDIEVVRGPGEPPHLRLHGGARRRAEGMRATGSLMTITHSKALAIVHVMLVRDETGNAGYRLI
jgi:holo-[acyl-carrier protein] synthase